MQQRRLLTRFCSHGVTRRVPDPHCGRALDLPGDHHCGDYWGMLVQMQDQTVSTVSVDAPRTHESMPHCQLHNHGPPQGRHQRAHCSLSRRHDNPVNVLVESKHHLAGRCWSRPARKRLNARESTGKKSHQRGSPSSCGANTMPICVTS